MADAKWEDIGILQRLLDAAQAMNEISGETTGKLNERVSFPSCLADNSAPCKAAFPVLHTLTAQSKARDKADLKDSADSDRRLSNTVSTDICALMFMTQVCDSNINPRLLVYAVKESTSVQMALVISRS